MFCVRLGKIQQCEYFCQKYAMSELNEVCVKKMWIKEGQLPIVKSPLPSYSFFQHTDAIYTHDARILTLHTCFTLDFNQLRMVSSFLKPCTIHFINEVCRKIVCILMMYSFTSVLQHAITLYLKIINFDPKGEATKFPQLYA